MEDGTIVAVESCHSPDHDVVAPGFVDLQVNGIDDLDVATVQPSQWPRLGALLAAQGVTAWCPTLVGASLDDLVRRVGEIAGMPAGGPVALGVHLEGPYLGGAPGAHRYVAAEPVDLDWIGTLPEPVRMVTLAPEVEGAGPAIAGLRRRGIVVALGHTTASAEAAAAAVDAGAAAFTHVFNASGRLHHRAPGALGVALTDDRLTVSLIADGHHLDPRIVRLVFRAKPRGHVALVTDAVAWRSGRLGRAGVEVRDGVPRRADGTLAGSTLTMDAAVRHCVREAGVDLADALHAAAGAPAALLGLDDRGAIAPGRRADLVILDADLRVEATWVAGTVQFTGGSGV